MSSKSKRSEPRVPLTSRVFRFWCPCATREASKLATAPFLKVARKRTASSTVERPVPLPLSSLRSLTKVRAIAPFTSLTSSPSTNRAMSMMCAFRSPCAPEPAFFFWKRQSSGVSGPPHSCR